MKHVMIHYYQTHDYFTSAISLYLALLKIVHLVESNIVEKLTSNLFNVSPREVHFRIRKVLEFKDTLSNQISVVVCLIFFQIFSTSVGIICRFQIIYFDDRYPDSHRLHSLLSLGRLGIAFIQVSFLVFMVHNWSRESQARLTVLSDKISMSQEHIVQWFSTLNVAHGYRYRAEDFFEIDRSLLLSFVASFIPLTVLMVQLINQALQ